MSADQTPCSPDPRLQNGRFALQQGRPSDAIQLLASIVASDPSCAEAYELLGVAHSMAGNRCEARAAFKRATQHSPQRATAHYNFAHFLYGIDELDEAAEENSTALFIAPKHAGALALQRNIQQRLKYRDYTAEQGFAVTGSSGPPTPSGKWKPLECPICGAPNYVTARVCEKCNMLMPEMDEVVPVE